MNFPPAVQTLVDQIVQQLGFPSGMRPIGLDIDMDDLGVVHRIEPRLRFKADAKALDKDVVIAQA